jgi:hypothetical protein
MRCPEASAWTGRFVTRSQIIRLLRLRAGVAMRVDHPLPLYTRSGVLRIHEVSV